MRVSECLRNKALNIAHNKTVPFGVSSLLFQPGDYSPGRKQRTRYKRDEETWTRYKFICGNKSVWVYARFCLSGGKMSEKIEIEYVSIDTIKPYENNAKDHPAEQVEQIKKSIETYGMIDPIGVWNNIIVEGHGRYEACKQLGIEVVPIIRLDGLTDEQRKEYSLVHNKLTMNSDFDKDMLMAELDELENFDLLFYGFDLDDEIEKEKEEKPEIEFTEVLGEDHNYLVLYFDNDVDWLQLESILDIKGKLNLSTRKDGKIGKNMKRVSVGRVMNGAKALERLREHYENIN